MIVAELCPNNQIRVKSYRLQEGYCRGRKKETAQEKEEAYFASLVQKLETAQKIHAFYSPEKTRLTDTSVPLPSYWAEQVELSANGQEVLGVVREYSQELQNRALPYLDLLKKSQQTKKRPRSWGKVQREKQFKRAGGEKILWGGSVLDKFVPKEDCRMLTLTLPGGTEEAKSCVSRWSGYLINRILQVARRWSYSEPLYWFFVWEHQKRDALHLHFCLGANGRGEEVELLSEEIAEKWFEVLLEFQEKEGVDCFARKGFQGTWRNNPSKWQWDCQPIKKSVAAYFAKYCQKNAQKTKPASPEGFRPRPKYYPSRYWGSSQTIKSAIKVLHRTKKFPPTGAASLEEVFEVLLEDVLPQQAIVKTWKYDFQVEIPESGVIVSSGTVWGFAFSSASYLEIWERFSKLLENRSPSSSSLELMSGMLHGCI